MAQSKFIQSVVKAAKGRPRSTEWFRDKIAEFGKPGALDLIRDGKRDNNPFYGRLNMFFYDPKFKTSEIGEIFSLMVIVLTELF